MARQGLHLSRRERGKMLPAKFVDGYLGLAQGHGGPGDRLDRAGMAKLQHPTRLTARGLFELNPRFFHYALPAPHVRAHKMHELIRLACPGFRTQRRESILH